jgi:NADPH-dependent curcumin reductase CurA
MNRQIHLVRYPDGTPAPGDFAEVGAAMPVAGPGEILVRVACLGLDPFPRLRMRADSRVGPPLPLNEVVDGRGVGIVIASNHPDFAAGDAVAGDTGWQQFAVLPAASVQRLDLRLGPIERHLSTLGPSGLTAFFTAETIAPRPGMTVAIAPAAGSVGVLAGQLLRAAGARVIGLVASPAQADFLTGQLGFDAALTDPAAIDEPVHGFIDGVGGALHDAVVQRLALHARVVLLGFIAAYNQAAPPLYGGALPILFKRALVSGFLLADHAADFARARTALAAMLDAGTLKPVETIHAGLSATPAAFAGLFGDPPPGKQIVRLEHPGA